MPVTPSSSQGSSRAHRVVLDEVGLVDDDCRPLLLVQCLAVAGDQVVVDDGPAVTGLELRRTAGEHLDVGAGLDELDLASPVELHRRRTDHEERAGRRLLAGRHDRRAGLAETHVVGEDRPPSREQERDTCGLVAEQLRIAPADPPRHLGEELGRRDDAVTRVVRGRWSS